MTDDLPKITAFPDVEVARNHGSRWSNAELSDDQYRALAVGFYYTYSWAAYADTVALLPEYDDEPETRRERSIEGLHRSWGVDNAADARDTIGALLRGMHAPIFEAVHPLAMEAAKQESKLGMPDVSSEHREFLRTLSKFRRESGSGGYDRYYETWWQAIKLGLVDSLPQPLQTDVTAWDLCRVVFVVRAAHTAGYLSEDEAWDHLYEGLAKAQRHYRNWRQLADGWLTGAIFWAAHQDLAAAKKEIAARRKIIFYQHVHQSSPWRLYALHPGAPKFGLGNWF
ncbi:DUF1266 domain-containing protein [Spirillospora sp. NPDC052242]